VRGMARFSVETNDADDEAYLRTQCMDIGDLFLCRVSLPAGTTTAILMVESLPKVPFPVAGLVEAGTVVEGKVLRFVNNPDADQPDTLIWDRTKWLTAIKVPGLNVNACILDIASFNGEASYRVSAALQELATAVTTMGAAPLKVKKCDILPYATTLLVAAGPGEADAARGKFRCPRCPATVSASDMRIHMARHIMAGQRNAEPWAFAACGFCGGAECDIAASKGSKKNMIPVSSCKLFYKFSMKSAATTKDTKASAWSTNHPVVCSACQVPTSVWSYNLASHFTTRHGGCEAPEELRGWLLVSATEKEALSRNKLP
jgi:hypothetical protein